MHKESVNSWRPGFWLPEDHCASDTPHATENEKFRRDSFSTASQVINQEKQAWAWDQKLLRTHVESWDMRGFKIKKEEGCWTQGGIRWIPEHPSCIHLLTTGHHFLWNNILFPGSCLLTAPILSQTKNHV